MQRTRVDTRSAHGYNPPHCEHLASMRRRPRAGMDRRLRRQSLSRRVVGPGEAGREGPGLVREKLGAAEWQGSPVLRRRDMDLLPHRGRHLQPVPPQLHTDAMSDYVEVREGRKTFRLLVFGLLAPAAYPDNRASNFPAQSRLQK